MKYLLRSLLFVPSYNEKFLNKASQCDADAIILDLEDSVPLEKEDEGRYLIRKYLTEGKFRNHMIFIRINEIGSKSMLKDFGLLDLPQITGLMIPKINTAEEIKAFEKQIGEREDANGIERGRIKLIPLIETAAAVLHAEEIAGSTERVIAIAFGGEDYLDSIHGVHTEPPKAFDVPRSWIVQAARIHGIEPIDTPFLNIKDEQAFMAEERYSAAMGFSGILLINPIQISWANRIFSPDPEEIDHARRIITAIQETREKSGTIAVLDGKLIGPPMRKRAEKIVDLADLIEQKNNTINRE